MELWAPYSALYDMAGAGTLLPLPCNAPPDIDTGTTMLVPHDAATDVVAGTEHKKLQAITNKQKQELLREVRINLVAHRLKMAPATGESIGLDPVPARKPLPYLDSEL